MIERNGLFLWGKRSLHKETAPGYWCPISGKIEGLETESEAVIREVREEVGLMVEPLQKVATIGSQNGLVDLHWWRVRIISGEAHLANDEHSEIRWFSLEELSELEPIFKEDLRLYQEIFK